MSTDFEYTLVGFPTRYSSWTARAATVLEYFQIPHKKEVYHLTETPYPTSRPVQPPYKGGLLPALVVHPTGAESSDFIIHDSLAILEFLAETHPELPLWPEDKQLRALARSAVAKMHSGFTALRNEFATNFIARYEFAGEVHMSEQAKGDCEKMVKLWSESRAATVERLKALGKEDGDEGFLFGKFGIADAFFWPVLWVSKSPSHNHLRLIERMTRTWRLMIEDSASVHTNSPSRALVIRDWIGWKRYGRIRS